MFSQQILDFIVNGIDCTHLSTSRPVSRINWCENKSYLLAFAVQAGFCPLGKSRREQVQTEEGGPFCLEPAALDGGTAFVRHLYKSGIDLIKYWNQQHLIIELCDT